MLGLMQDHSLMISNIIEFAAKNHAVEEIVSRTIEGPIHRYTYSDCAARSRSLAKVLLKLGVEFGDRIATLAWNGYRHMELYYAISGSGAICHTINPRLLPEQIAYIVNHAEDEYLFTDLTFVPLLEAIMPYLTRLKGIVVMTDSDHMPETKLPDTLCYETLISESNDDYIWPVFDERTASMLCYTSGTTGNPKGVLYSHRSTILHAYAVSSKNVVGLASDEALLPVVPMFHVAAWGAPYAAAMSGTKLVMPGAQMDGASIYELLEDEQVTIALGVPTVWMMLLGYMKQNNKKFSTLKKTVSGGSAVPKSMIETFEKDYGVSLIHTWGMTEMSPNGTSCNLRRKHARLSQEEKFDLRMKQGKAVYGVDMRIADPLGNSLPWDGKVFGNLKVRGPWIASGYFKGDGGQILDDDGWFDTGDVATIDEDGYMQIVDRSKDMIKSGGEWISSIDLENSAVGCPGIAEAAVIAVKHPKWEERPLLIAVQEKSAQITKADVLGHLKKSLAKWQLPDDVVFVDELPHTATGKILKTQLRSQYRDYLQASAQ